MCTSTALCAESLSSRFRRLDWRRLVRVDCSLEGDLQSSEHLVESGSIEPLPNQRRSHVLEQKQEHLTARLQGAPGQLHLAQVSGMKLHEPERRMCNLACRGSLAGDGLDSAVISTVECSEQR